MSQTNDQFDLRALVKLLSDNRWYVVIFVVSAMLTSLAITYVVSERYRAGTLIIYRPTDVVEVQTKFVMPQKTAFGFPVPSAPFDALGATLEQVGGSERVLRKVVIELNLDAPDPIPPSGWAYWYHSTKNFVKQLKTDTLQLLKYGRLLESDPTTEAIIDLQNNVTIEPLENYTVRVVVKDRDPIRAARIADKIAEHLVEEMRDLAVGSAKVRGSELEQQVKNKQQEVIDTRNRIKSLKESADFKLLDEETKLLLETIESLERELAQNRKNLAGAEARLQSFVESRAQIERMVKSSETIEDDAVHTELRKMRANYAVTLRGLLEKHGDGHPEVADVKARIEEVDLLLASTGPTRLTSMTSALNEVYQKTGVDEVNTKAEVKGLQAANDRLMQAVQDARSRLFPPSVEVELRELELELKLREIEYTEVATARDEFRIAESASIPEIEPLFNATPIHKPVSPIKIYHVGLSGLLALSLALAAVFVVDFARSQWQSTARESPPRAPQ